MAELASPLKQAILDAESKVRIQSRQSYGKLWDAYETGCKVLSRLAEQGGAESNGEPLNGAERLSLTASLLQSLFLVEELISSGHYVSAVAILRQHMEILARLIELRRSIVKKGKIPNVKLLPFRLSKNYGRLSEIFHTSRGEYLSSFVEDVESEEVAKFLPTYREDWSKMLLSVHVAHLVALAGEIDTLHKELYLNRDLEDITESLLSVSSILVETGFWGKIRTA
jgi:hypothetical protein